MDDTICFIKIEHVEYILLLLNGFDNNIEFTFEEENDDVLPFLDVLIDTDSIIQSKQSEKLQIMTFIWIGTPLPHIPGNEELWRHLWNVYIVCSTEDFLDKELKYLEKVFHENNDYPKYIIKQIPKQSPDQYNEQELDMIKRNFNLNEVVE